MLSTAETDAFSTKLTSLLRICRSISIGTNLQLSELVSPAHYAAKVAIDGSINGRNDTSVNVTGGTVNGDLGTFGKYLSC